MFEIYNKTLRSYAESLVTYVKASFEDFEQEVPVIIAKREVAMGKLAERDEERRLNLPFASVSFTGSFEIDPQRYNHFSHFHGISTGFKDDTKREINLEKRYPVLIPATIDFWGMDSDVSYGLFSNFLLHQSFDPLIQIADRENNVVYKTLIDITSVTDQSQDIEESTSKFYDLTVEVQTSAFFKLTGEVKTVLALRSIYADWVSGEIMGDVVHFDVRQ